MASAKRESSRIEEPSLKKARVSEHEPSQSLSHKNVRVTLNPADCDIDFNVEGEGLQGSALYEEGFSYCWSGSRANIGITGGKYCFGCKITSHQPVDMEDTPLEQQHVCRIGISRGDDAVRSLGESMNSFGYGGTGKFSNSGIFFDYGEKYVVGDTIICAVDLDSKPMACISFFKNGKFLGLAKHFDAGPNGLGIVGSPIKKQQWEQALFPHVLLKNTVVLLQFSINDGLVPEEGYRPWADAILDGNSVVGPALSNQNNCEVVMMVGLPASGKTSWAENHVKEHPEKRYVLLGTDLVLEQMKLPGLLRKRNYSQRFECLMDRATKIFNVLLLRASRIPRNFIIDQTNVYKSARKRKLRPFADYKKIAIVIFPRPEELKLRAQKTSKETGKEVPAEAVNEMLANYTFPTSKVSCSADEYFDQVLFVELNRAESQRFLDEMKRDISMKPRMSSKLDKTSQMSSCSTFMPHCLETPVRSDTGLSFSKQDAGDPRKSSYFHQNQSQSPFGKYYDSRCDSDRIRGCGGFDFTNHYQSRGPAHGSIDRVLQSYQVNDTYRHTGVGRRDFYHQVGVDYNQSNFADSVSTSLPQDTCYDGYIVESGGTSYGFSATRHPTYQPASQFPYGSHGTHYPRPSGMYPSPPPPRPQHMNFTYAVRHPRVQPHLLGETKCAGICRYTNKIGSVYFLQCELLFLGVTMTLFFPLTMYSQGNTFSRRRVWTLGNQDQSR